MVKLKDSEKKQLIAEQQPREVHSHGHAERDTVKKEPKSKEEKNRDAKQKVAGAVIAKTATLHDMDVIWYPLVTEKAVNMIESENKITFIVSDSVTKPEVRKAIEEAYGVKVIGVNVIRDMKGRKKAIVKLDKKNKASELATKLGVL